MPGNDYFNNLAALKIAYVLPTFSAFLRIGLIVSLISSFFVCLVPAIPG